MLVRTEMYSSDSGSGGSGSGSSSQSSGGSNMSTVNQSNMINPSIKNGNPPLTVAFNIPPFPPMPTIISDHIRLRWNFGDGAQEDHTIFETTVTHTYEIAGSFTVSVLAVSDGKVNLSPTPTPVYMQGTITVYVPTSSDGGGSQQSSGGGTQQSSGGGTQNIQQTVSSLISSPLMYVLLAGAAVAIILPMMKRR